MFIEPKSDTQKMLSMRVDDEMFYSLKALSQSINTSTSVLIRLALHNLLTNTRENPPNNWEELKSRFVKQEQTNDRQGSEVNQW